MDRGVRCRAREEEMVGVLPTLLRKPRRSRAVGEISVCGSDVARTRRCHDTRLTMDATRELRQTLAPTVERWLAALASTEPADRERVQQGVARTYRADGRSMPDLVVWFASPLAGALAAHLLYRAGNLGRTPVKPLGDRLCHK